jgi:predicted enzyme related to lactoylglutathione lyase
LSRQVASGTVGGDQTGQKGGRRMSRKIYSILTVLLCVGVAGATGAEKKETTEGGEMAKNPLVFWELASHDAEKSVAFFRDVFEWEIEFSEKLGFYIVSSEHASEPMAGGIFTLGTARLPFLTLYLEVDDIEAKAKEVAEHGGHIVEPPHVIGGSRICLFNEPSGVTFAMIERVASE